MSENQPNEIDLIEVFKTLLKNKKSILLSTSLFFTIGLAIVFYLKSTKIDSYSIELSENPIFKTPLLEDRKDLTIYPLQIDKYYLNDEIVKDLDSLIPSKIKDLESKRKWLKESLVFSSVIEVLDEKSKTYRTVSKITSKDIAFNNVQKSLKNWISTLNKINKNIILSNAIQKINSEQKEINLLSKNIDSLELIIDEEIKKEPIYVQENENFILILKAKKPQLFSKIKELNDQITYHFKKLTKYLFLRDNQKEISSFIVTRSSIYKENEKSKNIFILIGISLLGLIISSTIALLKK
jgi:hypothetical protein